MVWLKLSNALALNTVHCKYTQFQNNFKVLHTEILQHIPCFSDSLALLYLFLLLCVSPSASLWLLPAGPCRCHKIRERAASPLPCSVAHMKAQSGHCSQGAADPQIKL